MNKIAKKTYIACWNPDGQTPYLMEGYITNILKHKLWALNHDVRWRESLGDSIDDNYDTPRGSIYVPDTLHEGDRMFVLRTGSTNPQENILLYSAFFVSEPFLKRDWRQSGEVLCYMRFHEDTLIHPAFPSKFTCDYLQKRFPDYTWSGSNRGFVLDEKDALALELEWFDYFCQYDKEFSCEGMFYCQSLEGFASMYEWQENNNIEHGRAWCYINHLNEHLNMK